LKIIGIIVISIMFLINPILGLIGLSLVLLSLIGYVLYKAKTEGKKPAQIKAKTNKEQSESLTDKEIEFFETMEDD